MLRALWRKSRASGDEECVQARKYEAIAAVSATYTAEGR
jgi:hypothetical protein